MHVHCAECGKEPSEIEDCYEMAKVEGMTPDEYVIGLEGTYNKHNGMFLCNTCYIAVGMPSLPYPRQWKVPDDYQSTSIK